MIIEKPTRMICNPVHAYIKNPVFKWATASGRTFWTTYIIHVYHERNGTERLDYRVPVGKTYEF
jgi:hypothetical protein